MLCQQADRLIQRLGEEICLGGQINTSLLDLGLIKKRKEPHRCSLCPGHLDEGGKEGEAPIGWQLGEISHLLHQDTPVFEDDLVDDEIL